MPQVWRAVVWSNGILRVLGSDLVGHRCICIGYVGCWHTISILRVVACEILFWFFGCLCFCPGDLLWWYIEEVLPHEGPFAIYTDISRQCFTLRFFSRSRVLFLFALRFQYPHPFLDYRISLCCVLLWHNFHECLQRLWWPMLAEEPQLVGCSYESCKGLICVSCKFEVGRTVGVRGTFWTTVVMVGIQIYLLDLP